jgi:hypothetical protein
LFDGVMMQIAFLQKRMAFALCWIARPIQVKRKLARLMPIYMGGNLRGFCHLYSMWPN